MQKILMLTNIPSPYRVDFYNELGKQCDLTVVCEQKITPGRNDAWLSFQATNFKMVFLTEKETHADTHFSFSLLRYLKKGVYDHIVVGTFTNPSGLLAIAYLKLRGIPYEIESDGGFAKSGKGWRARLKQWAVSGATRCFSTGQTHDAYYLAAGARPSALVRYPFTSLFDRAVLRTVPDPAAKTDLRRRLGMNESSVVLSVGRFTYDRGYGKGYDLLVQHAKEFPATGFYVIGDEPTEEFLAMQKQYGADNVHFLGFTDHDALNDYYRAADVFVLLTRGDVWGLAVNEAMANGLPVITTDQCVAGLELVDETNGALIPVDGAAYANALSALLQDPAKRDAMARRSLEKIKPYTIENMARTHIKVWHAEESRL